jgi:hypothetical protein
VIHPITFADGFGRWHALVHESVPEAERESSAIAAITTELNYRERGPLRPVQVEINTTSVHDGFINYQERFDD